MKKKKKKRSLFGRIVSTVIMLAALCVFIYSAYQLYLIFAEYKRGTDEYKAIAEKAGTDGGGIPDDEMECPIDFDELLEINNDIVAWIQFEEPAVINYPVVQGEDNEYYLKHTFEKQQNGAGSIFMDFENKSDFSDQNTFIYGHNMKNRSMFGDLRKYKEKSFRDEYPYFYIYTVEKEVKKYEIFSVHVEDSYDDTYIKFYNDDEEFSKYLERIKSRSLFSTGVEVSTDDQIVSLSTCTSRTDRERLIVHGRLLK